MLKKIVLLCCTTIFSFADFEIDPDIEKHIDRYDVNSVEMIVNYYIDKDIKKAKAINDKVLLLHPNNMLALKNKKIIEEKLGHSKNSSVNSFNNTHLQKSVTSNNLISDMQNDYQKLLKARSAFNNKNYLKVQEILDSVKNKSALEYIKLKAYSCFEMHDYKCAKKYLSMLYSSTYSIKDAYKLIETYIQINQKNKASQLVNLLLTQYKGDSVLEKYKKELTSNNYSSFKKQKEVINDFSSNTAISNIPQNISTTNDVENLLKNYKMMPTFSNLNKLVYNMRNFGQKEESYYYLNQYFLKHPESDDIKYLYAKYLYEDKKYKKAIYFLESIILRSKNRQLVMKSKGMLGLIYYKLGKYDKAKSLLYSASKYSNSKEIKEALNKINKISSNYIDETNINETNIDNRIISKKTQNFHRKTIPNLDIDDGLAFNSIDTSVDDREPIINRPITTIPKPKPKKSVKIKRRLEKLNSLEIVSKRRRKSSDDFSLSDLNSTNIDFEDFNFDTANDNKTYSKKAVFRKRNFPRTTRSNFSSKQTDSLDDQSFSEVEHSSESIPQNIKDFINQWKKGWESRNIDIYSKFYADKYKLNPRWVSRKERIFSRTSFISLKLSNFNLLDHYKQSGIDFYKVRFYQVYSTDSRVDKGYKTLTLKCVDNRCVIYKENWSRAY